MGALGHYLRSAREARGIDLRDAAQQTRIGINYIKALENEDFSRLPGEVFVRGFLKNYCKFLRLDEAEVMKKYAELTLTPPAPVSVSDDEPKTIVEQKTDQGTPIEPFIWGAVIVLVLIVFLFTALPQRSQQHAAPVTTTAPVPPPTLEAVPIPAPKSDKLYLEIAALDSTWLLVRTDNSPQKKAVLKKGESLIWSADERFLISYERAGAVKLLLNGAELTVEGPRETVVRDLAITRAGIVRSSARPFQEKKPRVQPTDQSQPPVQQPQPPVKQVREQQAPITIMQPSPQAPRPALSSTPASTPQQEAPQTAPQQAPSQ